MARKCPKCGQDTFMFETYGDHDEYTFFCYRCKYPFPHVSRAEMIDLIYHEIMKKMGGG